MKRILRRSFPLVALFVASIIVLWIASLSIAPNNFDWPAWVQAVGSTAAIIAAFLITSQQHTDNLAVEEDRRNKDDFRRLQAIRALVANVNAVASSASRHINGPEFYFVPASMDTLQFMADCETAFRELPIFELPHEDMAIFCTNLTQRIRRLREKLETQNAHVSNPPRSDGVSLTSASDAANEVLAFAAKVSFLCDEAEVRLQFR